MKVYRTSSGILIENEGNFFLHQEDWDQFINNDELYNKLKQITSTSTPIRDAVELIKNSVMAPLGNQELWACGVTYLRSKVGRQEESKSAGGGDFYARVYEAERPEVFFKSTAHRVVGHKEKVRIRRDSTWDV